MNLPRDRWVGASPGLNVTPGGKALEALDGIIDYIERRQSEDLSDDVRTTLSDISELIGSVNLGDEILKRRRSED